MSLDEGERYYVTLMMSMVAIASPAPFTMHPMLPTRSVECVCVCV